MEDSGKWISGTAMIVFGVLIYFIGSNFIAVPDTCSGLAWINPVCWLSAVWDITASVIFGIVAAWTVLFGIMIYAMPAEKSGWVIILYIALTLALINAFVLDPIPFIDEFLLFTMSGIAGAKVFSDAKIPTRIPKF